MVKKREPREKKNPVAMAMTPALATVGTQLLSDGMAAALSNPPSDGVPFCGIALDGGPKVLGTRDNIVIVDRGGSILAMREVMSRDDLDEIAREYPDLPIFGPFHVIASDIRNLRKKASHGMPVVEKRRGSRS